MGLFSGAKTVDADLVTYGYLSLARLQQARGRGADARATLEEFVNLTNQRDFFPLLIKRGEAARARLALMQGDLPAAVSWAEASGLGAYDEATYPREEEYLTLVRVLIAQGRLDSVGAYLDDALGLLGRLFETAEGGGRIGSIIEILALRTLVLQARHESSSVYVGELAKLRRRRSASRRSRRFYRCRRSLPEPTHGALVSLGAHREYCEKPALAWHTEQRGALAGLPGATAWVPVSWTLRVDRFAQ